MGWWTSQNYTKHILPHTQHVCLVHFIPWFLVQIAMIYKGLKLQKWWTRNTEWEVTEIQPSVEDVSCHYLYLWPTNHNHKLYLPRSKIHPCQHNWYLFPPQSIQTSNRFKHICPWSFPFCPFSDFFAESWCSVAVVSPPAGFSLNNLPSSKRCSAAQKRPNTVTAKQNILPGVHNVQKIYFSNPFFCTRFSTL